MQNRKYAKLTDGRIEYAPAVIKVGGRTIIGGKTEHYAKAEGGPYYPVDLAYRPEVAAGYHLEANGYEVVDGVIIRAFSKAADVYTLDDYDAALEDHIRETREARGYTSREPSAYLNSSVPRWASDARDWVAFIDAVMSYALVIENQVALGGQAPTLDEFRAGLPSIKWTFDA